VASIVRPETILAWQRLKLDIKLFKGRIADILRRNSLACVAFIACVKRALPPGGLGLCGYQGGRSGVVRVASTTTDALNAVQHRDFFSTCAELVVMTRRVSPRRLRDRLILLQRDHEAIPCGERRALALELVHLLAEDCHPPVAGALVQILTRDPSPTVRRAVVNLLPLLPQQEFHQLALQLLGDESPRVRGAVQRLVDRQCQRLCQSLGRQDARDHNGMGRPNVPQGPDPIQIVVPADSQLDVWMGAVVRDVRHILSPLEKGIAGALLHAGKEPHGRQLLGAQLAKVGRKLAYLQRFVSGLSDSMSDLDGALTVVNRRLFKQGSSSKAHALEVTSTMSEDPPAPTSTKAPRIPRRGRPAHTDPAHDAKVLAAWRTKSYQTYSECGRAMQLSREAVARALDRARKREKAMPE